VGATPVFVDIDPQTFNMDPGALDVISKAARRLTLGRVKRSSLFTFLGKCEMEEIKILAGSFGIPVIEDAAQAIGLK